MYVRRALPYRTLRESIVSATRRRRKADREEFWALTDVDIEASDGEVVGVIGPNGAGKTTLLRILARITYPTTGSARVRGRVGSILEVGTTFHPELTGRENVFLNGSILGMDRFEIRRRLDAIVEFAGLSPAIDLPLKRYSTGMTLRLGFAIVANLDADVLLVDEILAVADSEFQRRCLDHLSSSRGLGKTVVFVSHDLDAVEKLCNSAIWLSDGTVRERGAVKSVIDGYLNSIPDRDTVSLPAANGIKVTRLALRDPSGNERRVFLRSQPFDIELQFEMRDEIRSLDIGLSIVDERGTVVVSELWSDVEGDRRAPAGVVEARIRIPPILNVGSYSVGVYFGTGYEDLIDASELVRFRLEGPLTDRPNRVVRLAVPWTVEGRPIDP
jgi:ABC-2 type transport system ATP-binding protein/lipopolysaccharide transport system ATP-binding protein